MRSKNNNISVNGIFSRRDFLRKTLFQSGTVLILGNSALIQLSCSKTDIGKPKRRERNNKTQYKIINVDYKKCTGCRTCETVCSSFNKMIRVNGKEVPGLGNPFYSNIKVYGYNPDVDIPSLCTLCPDTPCIEACPVIPDPNTKRKALFRDSETFAIKNDSKRCTGCGNCLTACKSKRSGIITLNNKTEKPEGICTLCNGDPKCVKYCPGNALSYDQGDLDYGYYGLSPEEISRKLIKRFYTTEGVSG